MSRQAKLFTEDRKATPFLMKQWRARNALRAIHGMVPLLEEDRSAKPAFRILWKIAFPAREPLPYGPLALEDGRGVDEFWRVFE